MAANTAPRTSALVYARARAPQEEEVLGLGAAAAEVLRLAAAEGLTLERSDNAVSFRGATRKRNRLQAGIGDSDTARQSPRAQRTACPKCRTEGVPQPLFVELVCEYCLESATSAVTWPCGHPACRARRAAPGLLQQLLRRGEVRQSAKRPPS
jgi:hypothetical protein